jgi:hypothetical protein
MDVIAVDAAVLASKVIDARSLCLAMIVTPLTQSADVLPLLT